MASILHFYAPVLHWYFMFAPIFGLLAFLRLSLQLEKENSLPQSRIEPQTFNIKPSAFPTVLPSSIGLDSCMMLQELTQLHNVFGGAAAVALPMPRVLTVHWPSSFLNKVVATISQKISRTPHSEAHAASNVFGLVPFCCRFAAISSQNMSI